MNIYYLYYNNDYDYNFFEFRCNLKFLIDNFYINFNSNVLVLNFNVIMIYCLFRYWGYYEYKFNFNYYYGWVFFYFDGIYNVVFEIWWILNGIKVMFNMFKIGIFE